MHKYLTERQFFFVLSEISKVYLNCLKEKHLSLFALKQRHNQFSPDLHLEKRDKITSVVFYRSAPISHQLSMM